MEIGRLDFGDGSLDERGGRGGRASSRQGEGPVRHHGSQPGRVTLGGKRVQLDRPRLRSKDGHEVGVPAYEALSSDPKQAMCAFPCSQRDLDA